MTLKNKNIFGLDFFSGSFSEAIDLIVEESKATEYTAKVLVTPNVDHIVKLEKDKALKYIYSTADYFFADGFPVVLASKLLGKSLKERITGADIFPAICDKLAKEGSKIYIVGGKPGFEGIIKEGLEEKYPGLNVEIYIPDYGFNPDKSESKEIINSINNYKPDITFVCLGMPKQEIWSLKYKSQLKTKLLICAGAALEFDLGFSRRAPRLFQKIGMEWFWRLCGQPLRLAKRYLVDDLAFLGILYKELKLSKK